MIPLLSNIMKMLLVMILMSYNRIINGSTAIMTTPPTWFLPPLITSTPTCDNKESNKPILVVNRIVADDDGKTFEIRCSEAENENISITGKETLLLSDVILKCENIYKTSDWNPKPSDIAPCASYIVIGCTLNTTQSFRDVLSQQRVKAIKHLTINDMNGTKFSKTFLKGLQNLVTLTLNNCGINNINTDIFEDITSIKVLNVSYNKIKLKNKFPNLTNLNIVDLSDNDMTAFPEQVFMNLRNLQELYLKRNKLKLGKYTFKGLENLIKLDMSQNKLTVLEGDIYEYIKKLKYLDISENKLSYLPGNIFKNQHNLTDLNVGYNHLKHLTRSLFVPLHNLKSLILQSNKLDRIETLPVLNELKTLDVSSNKLHWLCNNTDSPFEYLLSLTTFNLSRNSIEYMCDDWMYLPNMKYLDLSYNKIRNISTGDSKKIFVDLEALSPGIHYSFTLDLRYNPIERILIDENFESTSLQKGMIKAEDIILIETDSLICDCNMFPFLNYTLQEYLKFDKKTIKFFVHNSKCAYPNSLRNRSLLGLQPEEFICQYKIENSCVHSIQTHTKARIIECRNITINTTEPWPDPEPSKAFEFNHTELYLTNNNITDIHDLGVLSDNVTKLYLSGNNIRKLTTEYFPSNIWVLDIRNNNLVYVDESVANAMLNVTSLRELYISGNPIACDCHNYKFLTVLRYNDKVKDLNMLKCSNKIKVSQLNLDLLCSNTTLRITASVLSTGMLLLLLWVLTICYYRRKDIVKIWLNDNVKWSRKYILVPNSAEVENMTYDVFVSGSHLDNEIIVDELIKNLENDGYAVCWHERDWRGGELIIASIENSIQVSQTTLFFVTENFVKSTWSCREFWMAVSAAVTRRCFNILVVLHGDIGSEEELEPTLKHYLKNNTYLKWSDKLFWKRLRLSLPRKLADVSP